MSDIHIANVEGDNLFTVPDAEKISAGLLNAQDVINDCQSQLRAGLDKCIGKCDRVGVDCFTCMYDCVISTGEIAAECANAIVLPIRNWCSHRLAEIDTFIAQVPKQRGQNPIPAFPPDRPGPVRPHFPVPPPQTPVPYEPHPVPPIRPMPMHPTSPPIYPPVGANQPQDIPPSLADASADGKCSKLYQVYHTPDAISPDPAFVFHKDVAKQCPTAKYAHILQDMEVTGEVMVLHLPVMYTDISLIKADYNVVPASWSMPYSGSEDDFWSKYEEAYTHHNPPVHYCCEMAPLPAVPPVTPPPPPPPPPTVCPPCDPCPPCPITADGYYLWKRCKHVKDLPDCYCSQASSPPGSAGDQWLGVFATEKECQKAADAACVTCHVGGAGDCQWGGDGAWTLQDCSQPLIQAMFDDLGYTPPDEKDGMKLAEYVQFTLANLGKDPEPSTSPPPELVDSLPVGV